MIKLLVLFTVLSLSGISQIKVDESLYYPCFIEADFHVTIWPNVFGVLPDNHFDHVSGFDFAEIVPKVAGNTLAANLRDCFGKQKLKL